MAEVFDFAAIMMFLFVIHFLLSRFENVNCSYLLLGRCIGGNTCVRFGKVRSAACARCHGAGQHPAEHDGATGILQRRTGCILHYPGAILLPAIILTATHVSMAIM